MRILALARHVAVSVALFFALGLALGLALVLGAPGCGGSDLAADWGPSPSPTPTPSPSPIPAPKGRQLLAGALSILGVTSDHDIVYRDFDGAGSPVMVVPLTGGTPQLLLANAGVVRVSGRTVIICRQPSANSIRTWNRDGSLDIDNASCTGTATPDGKYLLYFTGTNATNLSADLRLAKLDGSSDVKILSDQSTDELGWAGGRFIVPAHDNQVTVSVYAIDPVTAETTTIADGDARPFSVVADEKSGKLLYVTESSGQLNLVTPDGAVTLIDSEEVMQAGFSADANSVFYVTKGGDLRRWTAGAAPLQLVDQKAENDNSVVEDMVFRISPDEKWISLPDNSWFEGWLVSADQHTVLGTPLAGYLEGGVFTDDSAYFVYYTMSIQNSNNGTLMASPVAGGAPIWIADHVYNGLAFGTGDQLVLQTTSTVGVSDLFVGTPRGGFGLVAAGADAYFAIGVSARRGRPVEHILYTVSVDPATAGLYDFEVY